MKRKIVEKNLELIRLGEEESLIVDEMKSVLNYFQVRGYSLKQGRACLVRKLENSDFSLSGNNREIIFLVNSEKSILYKAEDKKNTSVRHSVKLKVHTYV